MLVAVMVVAGVVALVLTLFGGKSSGKQAAVEPSGSQVGNQSIAIVAPSSSAGAPSTSAAAPIAKARAETSKASTPKASASKAKPTKANSANSANSATKVVKYTVKKGDNLTLIAGWFNQRGYGLVYDWNKSVIGRNPDLIYAGQTIIVSLTGDHLKVSTGKS